MNRDQVVPLIVIVVGVALFGVVSLGLLFDTEASSPLEWRTFDTPAGEILCLGTAEVLDGYDLAADCLSLDALLEQNAR